MFYPFILMDIPIENVLNDPWTGAGQQPSFPWRGRITLDTAPGVFGNVDKTGAAGAQVAQFFGTVAASDFTIVNDEIVYSGPAEWSFRRFILHSAWLCKMAGGVAAFCIGSEMRSLTQIRDSASTFPAVQALIALAADVRGILGPQTKLSYAADWSEYFGFQPSDGSGDIFFHLDPLWASDDIDFIGIDNYMPLSDWRDGADHADLGAGSIYNLDYLKGNIAGGEGYDWYYVSDADREAQIRTPIQDLQYGEDWIYRYKDILSWWSNAHFDRPTGVRDILSTDWQPMSKPIWFTELGCAAMDKATNQPNVFLDVKSSESAMAYFSSGLRDDFIQYRYLQAHFDYWGNPDNNPNSLQYSGPMVNMSRAHIWAWDARPWPDFPEKLETWSDGGNYDRGHWISGRTGIATLAAVVSEIAERSGFSDYDVSDLNGAVHGYTITSAETARQSLQPLMLSNAFDAFENEGKVVFKSRSGVVNAPVEANLLAQNASGDSLRFSRNPEADIANRVQINYYQFENDFQRGAASASIPVVAETVVEQTDIPVALTPSDGAAIAARWLTEASLARDEVSFTLPLSMLAVTPGDVISLTTDIGTATYRVDRIDDLGAREVQCTRVESGVYHPGRAYPRSVNRPSFTIPGPVYIEFMDIPLIAGTELPHAPHLAVSGTPWTGRVAVYVSASDSSYELNTEVFEPSVVGTLVDALPLRCHGLWAWGDPILVTIPSGQLQSRSEEDVLNGANVAAIRSPGQSEWEIIQFQSAELIGGSEYLLNGFLRGQFGTEAFIPAFHPIGSDFVLLNAAVTQINLAETARGLERHYRIGPASRSFDDVSYEHFTKTFDGVGLRPYAPAHVGVRVQSSGDYYISWIRQTRIGGDSWIGLRGAVVGNF